MSHSITRASIIAPDTASTCSLASTISVNWEDEIKRNTDPPADRASPPTAFEGGDAGTKTDSLIIRNLFIIGFLIPLAWIIAVIKVFILDRDHPASPITPTTDTSATGQTDIEANILPKKERYCEGPYWACLCLVAGTVYIAGGVTIVWIYCVEKERWGV